LPLTDWTADRVFGQANDFNGNLCNRLGVSANSLCNPYGVVVDGPGNVYVSDSYNSRILVYVDPSAAIDADGDGVSGTVELACGSDPLVASSLPERLDTPGDDNGDGLVNEALPAGSEAYDCDGDGFSGRVERSVFSARDTAGDQKRCGVSAWPPDINSDGLVDMIGDIVPVVGRFAQSVPPAPTRYDMAPSPPDKLIDIFDIVRMTGVFGQSC